MMIFREAKREDLERIVQLLADDVLGTSREDVSSPYIRIMKKRLKLLVEIAIMN